MKSTIAVWLCLPLALLSQSTHVSIDSPGRYPQTVLLQNWALSRCLAQVYVDNSEKDDATATPSAFLEYGTVPVNAYDDLTILVDKYAKRTYRGSIKSDFNTMKCIDLFRSKELTELIKKIVAASSRRANATKR